MKLLEGLEGMGAGSWGWRGKVCILYVMVLGVGFESVKMVWIGMEMGWDFVGYVRRRRCVNAVSECILHV